MESAPAAALGITIGTVSGETGAVSPFAARTPPDCSQNERARCRCRSSDPARSGSTPARGPVAVGLGSRPASTRACAAPPRRTGRTGPTPGLHPGQARASRAGSRPPGGPRTVSPRASDLARTAPRPIPRRHHPQTGHDDPAAIPRLDNRSPPSPNLASHPVRLLLAGLRRRTWRPTSWVRRTSGVRSSSATTTRARSSRPWSAARADRPTGGRCCTCTASSTTSSRPTWPTSSPSAATTSTPWTCASTAAACCAHQTPNFCPTSTSTTPSWTRRSGSSARRTATTPAGHGHSTGGLITALWAHRRRGDGIVDGLFLNSPFFDFNVPWVLRARSGAESAGPASRPYRVMPPSCPAVRAEPARRLRGEWAYDLGWKPVAAPVRSGWLAAVRGPGAGSRRARSRTLPVLVGARPAPYRGPGSGARAGPLGDTVLDVATSSWAQPVGPPE